MTRSFVRPSVRPFVICRLPFLRRTLTSLAVPAAAAAATRMINAASAVTAPRRARPPARLNPVPSPARCRPTTERRHAEPLVRRAGIPPPPPSRAMNYVFNDDQQTACNRRKHTTNDHSCYTTDLHLDLYPDISLHSSSRPSLDFAVRIRGECI